MSTSKQFTVRKHLVNKYRVSADGYYDTIVQKKVTGDDTLTVNLTPWPTPDLQYTASDYDPGKVSLNSGDFKDHSIRKADTKVLMPYDNGKLYKDIKTPSLNYYLVNNGCNIEDGVATFSGSNSLLINRELGTYSSLEITLKCLFSTISKHSAVASDSTSTERDIGIRNSNKFSMYCNGWQDGSTTVEADKWYFLKLVVSDNTSKFYTLDAEDYEYSTLPSIENWTLESTVSGKIFSDKIYLGYDFVYHDESLVGKIDLNQSKILVNNEVFWEYPQTVFLKEDLQGCLLSEDSGSMHTFTGYYIKNSSDLTHRLVLSDTTPVGNSDETVYKLTTLTIPAHDLYSYSIGHEHSDYTEFTRYGAVSLDTTTGVASGFSNSNYLQILKPFKEALNSWDICFKVTVPNDITSNGRLLNSCGSYDQISFQIGSAGLHFRFYDQIDIVTSNIPRGTYYVKCVGKNGTGTLYTSEDGQTWTAQASNQYTPQAMNIQSFDLGCRTYDFYSGCIFSGSIDLSESYIKINNTYFFQAIKDIGVWTKL